jgi:acyl-homoserine-lactone acylase
MRMPLLALALAGSLVATPAFAADPDLARWQAEAARVQIVRDDWGIAHVHGKSDADAVFGAIYAQAEDDFNRVETNYITALGRTAETEGVSAIWQDLRQRLYIDPVDLQAKYAASPDWLKKLMDAWADGLNYYLATHSEVQPKVLTHFEPWMALSFSEGSIGGDIERISLSRLRAFYEGQPVPLAANEDPSIVREPSGSNGIAIAPKNTKDGHALLLINPHTSFFFRSELQMSSDEGLDAYGASTWGQFFIYQGFNPHLGWMHTSSGVDVVDEFAETIVKKDGTLFYKYGDELRPVTTSQVTLAYRTADGSLDHRTFTVYRTHHGPVVREAGGKWITTALMNTPVPALEQSFLRTKADDFASYMKVMQLKANSSNNTIYADDKGTIAYLHPQFVPLRDDRFDYTHPVDGSNPATDWKGLTPLDKLPQVVNPGIGWVKNSNDWPWTAAGPDSPKAADFPRYMDQWGENPRGPHARMVLEDRHDFTLDKLQAAAFDSYLPAFARLIPTLVADFDAMPASNPLKAETAAQVKLLRDWDYRWGADSEATSLAVFWAEDLWQTAAPAAADAGTSVYDAMAAATPAQKLQSLDDATGRLSRDFGSWRVPWGTINRFQRLDDSIDPHFDDAKPSIPVPFTSSRWGSLASFGARSYPNTNKYYGTSGNSFVAVVEFGDEVHARAVTAGGESGHPASPHFNDEAQRYASGNLRTVYFTPEQLKGHTERRYHPGE